MTIIHDELAKGTRDIAPRGALSFLRNPEMAPAGAPI